MYMAIIGGWDEVIAFHDDPDTAKSMAVDEKRNRCFNDLDKWTWQECKDYYGANLYEIKSGTVYTYGFTEPIE